MLLNLLNLILQLAITGGLLRGTLRQRTLSLLRGTLRQRTLSLLRVLDQLRWNRIV